MIKTQDLKLQMDELTKQNDMVLIELEQVKKMLINSSQSSQGNQGQQQFNNSSSDQQASDSNQQAQGQNQDQNQNQSKRAGQGDANGQQVTDLANDLLKIKDLVEKLEQKTSQYVSSQSNGTLTEKDAVNLILTLMNGMVDWASEFVSSRASSNGQVQ
ncbi:hypothetical protein [Paenibacillus alginolyticus]|uniref:Uncharacterized protein n=1 Tax=Paenibacillus alginolyticus TaxID=59839 RepID=A0ABT4GJ33_9BACL|nr:MULTISPECIES: hypothetical protein [Paenibacillus]MCY9696215.1 hypothetical protein [Paenibacillus alginolyticus]MEC0142491.1 hypothetical protein [Paenibacillus alginolyticus]NRF92697.1 hypothetical protein [Paenibacillus frigoriresistens]